MAVMARYVPRGLASPGPALDPLGRTPSSLAELYVWGTAPPPGALPIIATGWDFVVPAGHLRAYYRCVQPVYCVRYNVGA